MALPTVSIGTIIKVIELGNEIINRYTIYIHAKADLGELDSRLRASLFVLGVFQKVIKRGIASTLYRQEQDTITCLITHLQGVFVRLDKQLSEFPRDAKLNILGKLRWTFKGKSGYEAILHEMTQWESGVHRVVEAIKFLREDEKEEDRRLYKQLFGECGGVGIRCADKMDDMLHGREIPKNLPPMDNALLSYIRASDNLQDGNHLILKGRKTFVEFRSHSEAPQGIEKSIEDTNKLASLLHQVDTSSMHILRCKGTIHQARHNPSLLFYEMPSEPTNRTTQWTLAQAIEDRRKLMPPLNSRVRFAVEISMAVMFTHAAGLVHKSIYPENVLILRNSPADNVKHEFSAYVVGFHAARLYGFKSSMDGAYYGPGGKSVQRAETDTLKRLYQHPERQIPLQDGKVMRFTIRHDMYSLGVVLLELAMWRRIKHINDPDLQKLIHAEWAFDSRKLQAKLARLADQSLLGSTGRKYAEAVRCCLQDTIKEKNERKMRELFYERVLQPLKEIIL